MDSRNAFSHKSQRKTYVILMLFSTSSSKPSVLSSSCCLISPGPETATYDSGRCPLWCPASATSVAPPCVSRSPPTRWRHCPFPGESLSTSPTATFPPACRPHAPRKTTGAVKGLKGRGMEVRAKRTSMRLG